MYLQVMNRPRRPKSYANGSRRPLSTDSEGSEFPESTSPLCLVLNDYVAQYPDELTLRKGDVVKVLDSEINQNGWCTGEINGKTGLFPFNRTRIISREDVLLRYKANEIVLPDTRGLEYSRLGFGATAMVCRVQVIPSRQVGIGRFARLYDKQGFALKKFNETFGQERLQPSRKTAVEKLQKEARLLNELSHENIVEFLGYCTDKKYFGLLLELCHGGSLRELCDSIPKKQPMPLKVLVNWAVQIASGMKYLAGKDYIHRDLKPENILVKQVGCVCDLAATHCSKCKGVGLGQLQLKIADFGVTRKMESTSQVTCVGTYAYIAPETFKTQTYSEESDVWSFGVVLWEIMTRKVPFEGENRFCVAFNVANTGQRLVIPQNCPEKWKMIMQLCWEYEATDRPKFSHLLVFLEDYRDRIREKGIMIPPFSFTRPTSKEPEQGLNPRNEYLKLINSYYPLDDRSSPRPPELPKRSEIKREPVVLRKPKKESRSKDRSRARSCGNVLDRSRKVPEVFEEDVPRTQKVPEKKKLCEVDRPVSSPGRSNFFVPLERPFVINRFYCDPGSDKPMIRELYQSVVIKDSMALTTYTVQVPRHYTDLKFVENSSRGLVFSSIDNKLQIRVLITRVKWYDGEKSNLEWLFKEIAVLAESNHQCIARLLNIFTPPSDKVTYLVTKYADTLKNALDNGRITSSIDHKNLSYFLYQMLSGIQYLHDSGVIHQNFTQSCFIVDHDNQTLQIRSFYKEAITEKVDIWSVARVFLEIYTHHSDGKIWLESEITSLMGLLRMHPHDEYSRKDMTELHACDLLFKMLKTDPKERISAGDALKHPYVSSWVDKQAKKKSEKIQWRLETGNKTRSEIEGLFVQKLKQYKYKLEGGTVLEL